MEKVIKQQILSFFLMFTSLFAYSENLKVGISLVDLSNPFFAILSEELSQQLHLAQGSNQLDIIVHSSAYDLNQQNQQIQDFIDKGVDLLFISASESEAIFPIISQARAQGIVVVAVDIESRGADISVTTDNFQAGKLSCEYLVQRLAGRGKVAIINGSPISSVVNRVAGCRHILDQHTNIELVSEAHNGSGSFSGGVESMTYLLQEFPNLDAVFSINDLSSLGAEEALIQAQNHKVIIASVDGSPEVVRRLNLKETHLVASAAQFPRQIARQAVALALKKLTNDEKANSVKLISTKLITAENMQHYANWEQIK